MQEVPVFEIRFDHPQSVYYSGETLRGHVVVQHAQPMKVRNIRCCLYGQAKVHWSCWLQNHENNDNNLPISIYNTEENYFDHTIMLFGTTENDGLIHPPGEQSYPFEFPLPMGLPTSFESRHGQVRYRCSATIDIWEHGHKALAAFTVLSILDLNSEPADLRAPMQGEDGTVVQCCDFISGSTQAVFMIDKTGYVPGECIMINAEIHNHSNIAINNTRVALIQYVVCTCFSDGVPTRNISESQNVVVMQRGPIARGASDVWDNLPLKIPAVPSSRLAGCQCIEVSYMVQLYVSVNFGKDIKLAYGITIGTVPLWNTGGATDEVVTKQPLPPAYPAGPSEYPAGPSEPRAPLLPPPSYEEYMGGRGYIGGEGDTEKTQWAPVYPTYNFPPPTAPPPPAAAAATAAASTAAAAAGSEAV